MCHAPTCPKAKFRKIFYLFKQILSQFSLVPGFWNVG